MGMGTGPKSPIWILLVAAILFAVFGLPYIAEQFVGLPESLTLKAVWLIIGALSAWKVCIDSGPQWRRQNSWAIGIIGVALFVLAVDFAADAVRFATH